MNGSAFSFRCLPACLNYYLVHSPNHISVVKVWLNVWLEVMAGWWEVGQGEEEQLLPLISCPLGKDHHPPTVAARGRMKGRFKSWYISRLVSTPSGLTPNPLCQSQSMSHTVAGCKCSGGGQIDPARKVCSFPQRALLKQIRCELCTRSQLKRHLKMAPWV